MFVVKFGYNGDIMKDDFMGIHNGIFTYMFGQVTWDGASSHMGRHPNKMGSTIWENYLCFGHGTNGLRERDVTISFMHGMGMSAYG